MELPRQPIRRQTENGRQEFGIEAGSQFEYCGGAPAGHDASSRRLQNSADDLEQGALAGAVGSDYAEGLAVLQGEADVAQCPEVLVARPAAGKQFPQPVGRPPVQTV